VSSGSKLGKGAAGLGILLLGLASGGLLALSPDIAMPLAVLMLPGLIALVLDRSPGCGLAQAVLLFQATACVHSVAEAWYGCAGVDSCMGFLASTPLVMRTWLAGAAAFMIAQILPLVLKALDDRRLQKRRAVLIARRETLLSEWGLNEDSE
jgi:hypothetical protein